MVIYHGGQQTEEVRGPQHPGCGLVRHVRNWAAQQEVSCGQVSEEASSAAPIAHITA